MLDSTQIRLRALEPEDLELLYLWENDTEVWEVSHTQTPFSRFVLKMYIESAHQDIYTNKQLRLIIERKSDGLALGCIDLFDFDPNHKRAGIGILIAFKEYRGKGYASEALQLIKAYTFHRLGLHQLYCNILKENTQSLHLFEKHGFQVCGTKKDWVRYGNQWKDELTLQCIRVVEN